MLGVPMIRGDDGEGDARLGGHDSKQLDGGLPQTGVTVTRRDRGYQKWRATVAVCFSVFFFLW
jgi:hypothetical protein